MGWKATGEATIRQQRGKWVVRLDGVDTETGQRRPRQLGTYPTRRVARTAATKAAAEGDQGKPERIGRVVGDAVGGLPHRRQ